MPPAPARRDAATAVADCCRQRRSVGGRAIGEAALFYLGRGAWLCAGRAGVCWRVFLGIMKQGLRLGGGGRLPACRG
jgi:hypothetical protein